MTGKVAKAVVFSFRIRGGVVESWACLLVVVAIAGRRDQEHRGAGYVQREPKAVICMAVILLRHRVCQLERDRTD